MKNLIAAFLTALVLIIFPYVLSSCNEPELAKLEIRHYPLSETMNVVRSSEHSTQYDESDSIVSDKDLEIFETVEPDSASVTEYLPVETQASTEPVITTVPVTEPITVPTETEAVTSAPGTPPARSLDRMTDTVYWVASGEVWHLTESCPSLSRSKNISSGSITDALSIGKARVCKRCGKTE